VTRAFGCAFVLGIALVACSAERRDWHSAESADTSESYGRFLAEHPDGARAEDARARLAQLAEERDWKRAVMADTAGSYQRFLAQHPNGKWAGEARIRAENFVLSETMPAVPGAADRPLVEPPRRGAAPSTSSAFGVQLGAFGSEAGARQAWRELTNSFPSELGQLTPEVTDARTAAGRLYRLHAGVGDERHARELCARLTRAGRPCVVVLPP
jgi:hypothetical protein